MTKHIQYFEEVQRFTSDRLTLPATLMVRQVQGGCNMAWARGVEVYDMACQAPIDTKHDTKHLEHDRNLEPRFGAKKSYGPRSPEQKISALTRHGSRGTSQITRLNFGKNNNCHEHKDCQESQGPVDGSPVDGTPPRNLESWKCKSPTNCDMDSREAMT